VGETVWDPLFVSASFTPNPVIVGQPTLLSIIVIDVFGKEQDDIKISGEYSCGEV